MSTQKISVTSIIKPNINYYEDNHPNNIKKSILTSNVNKTKQLKNSNNGTNQIFLNSNANNMKLNHIPPEKYKTTKNSPPKLLIGKNIDNQSNQLKISKKKINNNNNNTNTSQKINKPISKIFAQNINNMNNNINSNNNTNKPTLKNKIQEIFHKKLIKMNSRKKYLTTKNSNNNSITQSNNKNNNNNTSFDLNENKKTHINSVKQKLCDTAKNINSYREYTRTNSKNKRKSKDNLTNYYGKTCKDFYLIRKYISSAMTSNRQQPLRKQVNSNIEKNKFNTISEKKKIIPKNDIKNNFTANPKITNTKKLSKNDKEQLKLKNSKIYGKSNIITTKKIISRTAYPTKQNSRKQSIDKDTNKYKYSNNNKNNNRCIKKINQDVCEYEGIGIKKSVNQNINGGVIVNSKNYLTKFNSKYKFSRIYSSNNSKEQSREKLIMKNKNKYNEIKKNSNIEKLFTKFQKYKKNSINGGVASIKKENNCSKDEKNQNRNASHTSKPQNGENIIVKHKKVYSNSNINGFMPKNCKKSKYNEVNGANGMNRIFLNNYLAHDPNSANNSKHNIKDKNSFVKSSNNSKSKIPNKFSTKKLKDISKENNNNDQVEFNSEKKIIDTRELEKCRDADISLENNDSLYKYMNNNIDNEVSIINGGDNINLNESYDSFMSSIIKENNKFYSYNNDMKIISTYIKKYYNKYQNYPKTKMKFYKYGRLLGKGAFGKVNLSLHTLTGRLVAIKSINKSKLTNERQKQKIKIETGIMKSLSNSNNVVKFFETYETKKHICIVMEYICAGDLLSYIKKRSKLTEPVSKFIFKQIILALQYIHSHNIVHRDIKLDNILIDLDNNIKICDFGVSKIIKKGDIMVEQCGTPAYIAPEILKNRGYEGFAVDIWSAGVVLYAMLSGTVPFKGGDIKELHELIINGKFNPIKNISKEATSLINKLLEVDPKNRITVDEILTHPWIMDLNMNFFRNQNLFTNAEHILLAKSNVDYRDINNKEDMIENFELRNLDTANENLNINIKTKSYILAPFNTSLTEYDFYDDSINDLNNPDLVIRNNIIKFPPKVRDLNRNYELNNNQEIDNGIVISPQESEEKVKKNKSPCEESYNSKKYSKQFSPVNELENNNVNINNNTNKGGDSNKKKNLECNVFNEKALEYLENLGYKKDYVKNCITNKEFNYATASYMLLIKYCYS